MLPCFGAAVETTASLGHTYRFAQLAGDAPLLARWVPPKRMFAAESWRDRSFLKGIVDGIPREGRQQGLRLSPTSTAVPPNIRAEPPSPFESRRLGRLTVA